MLMIRNTIALQRFRRTAFRLASLASCATLCWGVSVAHSATFDGHSGLNGNWSTPTNWVGNVAPTSGSPNLEVRLDSTVSSTATSNQDLGSPFVLQDLKFGSPVYFLDQHTINGSPIAFSNLGAPPTIQALDGFVSPDLVMNVDMIFNTDVTLSIEGGGDAASRWYFNGAISGAGGLKTSPPGLGGGLLYLGGASANTYAGLTTINYGWAYLNKPASVIAIPGDLVLNRTSGTRDRSGRVYILNDDQIAVTSKVTLNGGTLYVEGGDQTLANVEFTGLNSPVPEADGGNIVISPTRTLTITGGITRVGLYSDFLKGDSSIAGGTLDLGGGTRPFHVGHVEPEWSLTELTVSSVIANGDIEKTGAGLLHLSGANNTFAGNVLVNAGRFSMGQGFQMIFGLQDSGVSNRILGTADADFDGIFNIDPAAVTDVSGIWNLVDVANLNETFQSELKLQLANGTQFSKVGNLYKSGRWSFSTATGNLTLAATPEPTGLGLATIAALVATCVGRRGSLSARTK
jgi:autotransporter-associated beta strand protein